MSVEMRRSDARIIDASRVDPIIEHLRGIRRQRDISVDDLADRIGVTPRRINGIEDGSIDPEMSLVRKYANGIGVALYFGVGETTNLNDSDHE